MKKVLLLAILALSLIVFAGCNSATNNYDDVDDVEDVIENQVTTSSNTLVGDWSYEGIVNDKYYDITLDLENNGTYSLDVDEETGNDFMEATAAGTYTVTDNTIELTVSTVSDPNGYFTDAVAQNGQVDLTYTKDNQTLTITNISDTITFLTDNLVLTYDN